MNLIIFAIMSVILANHFGDSSVWPLRAGVWSPSAHHHVVRRATIPHWLKALRAPENGRLNWNDRLRKHRDAEGNKGIFSGLDSPVVSEAYIQPAQKENVIASNSKDGDNMGGDTVIFENDKTVVNRGQVESGSGGIDFGVQDRMKNKSPQSLVGHPPTKTNSSANAGNNRATSNKSEMTNVSSSVNFIDQADWTPVVDESQCQSIGPTMFCDNVPNYPEEAIRQILMSDKGNLLTTLFADNIAQPLPSASESDETMVFAQRKPETPVTVQAINTRNKESPIGKDETLCETTTTKYFPKIGLNLQKEMRYIVNTREVTQEITEERCGNENGPCSGVTFSAGDSGVCRQKYMNTTMAVVRDGKIIYEKFIIPSCCVCVRVTPFLRSASPVSVARRSLAMPSSFQRMAAEVEGATIVA